MNNHFKKIISIKGIMLFALLVIMTVLISYVRHTYLNYLKISTLKTTINIGINHSFIGELILSVILGILNKIILSKLIASL